MNSTFATISVEEVISRAKMSLRITNSSEYDSFLEVLCYEGLNSLSALSQLVKKNCPLNITDSTAELPKDFVRYLALRIDIEDSTTNDPINNQLLNGCQSFLYADNALSYFSYIILFPLASVIFAIYASIELITVTSVLKWINPPLI